MGLKRMIMDRIKIVKDFLSKDECISALDYFKNGKDPKESDVYKKINDYVNSFIKLKGYKFSELSPLILNTHNVGPSNLKWDTDTQSYITILIQLNDSYEQGYFQFSVDDDTNYFQLHHGAGHMVVFFSNLKYRTSPIESGIKYTITTSISLEEMQNYKHTII
jgi:hypothetical protein